MRDLLRGWLNQRMRALIAKELDQIRRDRRVLMSLILPPVLQLLLFGSVLSPAVANLHLGVVDDSRTPESRELTAVLSESKSFQLAGTYTSSGALGDAISRGRLDAGVVIPYDFARQLRRGHAPTVQVLVNAVNANTAALGAGYVAGIVQSYNQGLAAAGIRPPLWAVQAAPTAPTPPAASGIRGQALLMPAFLFNPGLVTSWFVVTGLFGMLLIMNGSIIASTTMVKEREAGTLEQLLMTPASTSEIIVAKIAPPFVLLCGMTLMAIAIIRFVFGVPFRGNVLVVVVGAALCLLTGIGIGTFIATFTKSAQQAQLVTFFMTPPLSSLSGALTPAEAMPHWMQPFTIFNPVFHFGVIARANMIKGSGFTTLWPNLLALLVFALVLVSTSVWRFRQQLG
jgi:ABC-2 type transport system permease protein